MMQSGPSDYRSGQPSVSRDQADGLLDQVTEIGGEIGDRAATMASDIGQAIKERPLATLAIAAGLAFAVGAIWKLGQRPQSRADSLLAQLSELSSRNGLLPRSWR